MVLELKPYWTVLYMLQSAMGKRLETDQKHLNRHLCHLKLKQNIIVFFGICSGDIVMWRATLNVKPFRTPFVVPFDTN
jgi:hypothetical protein